jgi:hypothetical protein
MISKQIILSLLILIFSLFCGIETKQKEGVLVYSQKLYLAVGLDFMSSTIHINKGSSSYKNTYTQIDMKDSFILLQMSRVEVVHVCIGRHGATGLHVEKISKC